MENGAICFCNAFPAPYLATQAVGGEKDGVAVVQQVPSVISVVKINPTTVEVLFSNQQRMTLDFMETTFSVYFKTTTEAYFVTPKQNRKQKSW